MNSLFKFDIICTLEFVASFRARHYYFSWASSLRLIFLRSNLGKDDTFQGVTLSDDLLVHTAYSYDMIILI